MFGVKDASRMRARCNGLSKKSLAKYQLIQVNCESLLELSIKLQDAGVSKVNIVKVLMGRKSLESVAVDPTKLEIEGVVFEYLSGLCTSGTFIKSEISKILAHDIFKSGEYFGYEACKKTEDKFDEFMQYLELIKPKTNHVVNLKASIITESKRTGSQENNRSQFRCVSDKPKSFSKSEQSFRVNSKKPLEWNVEHAIKEDAQHLINKTLEDFNRGSLNISHLNQFNFDYSRSKNIFVEYADKKVKVTDIIAANGNVEYQPFTGKLNLLSLLAPLLIRQDYRSILLMSLSDAALKHNIYLPKINELTQVCYSIDEQLTLNSKDNIYINIKGNYSIEDEEDNETSFEVNAKMKSSSQFLINSISQNFENANFGVSGIEVSDINIHNPILLSSYIS